MVCDSLVEDIASNSVPTLVEDAVRHLATYVLASAGIEGLKTFRLVCHSWNYVGAELMERQNWFLKLGNAETHKIVAEENRIQPDSNDGDGEPRTICNFIKFAKWRAEQMESSVYPLHFRNLHLVDPTRTELTQLLQVNAPWAAHVQQLVLSQVSVYLCNENLKDILEAFPSLIKLELSIDKEPESNNNDPGENESQKCTKWFDSNFREDRLQHENLQKFSFKSISLDMGDGFSRTENLLPFVGQHLRGLEPKPVITSLQLYNVMAQEIEVASLVNHFAPKKVKTELYDTRIRIFFQKLDHLVALGITELDLHLVRWSSKINLMDLFLSSIPPNSFKNLEVLKLRFGKCLGDSISQSYLVPKLEGVKELSFAAYPAHTKQITEFHNKIPQAFPNLEVLKATPKTCEEARWLLLQLSSSEKLRKLYLSDTVYPESCLSNSVLFGDGFEKSSYKGLLAISRLQDLYVTFNRERPFFDEDSFRIGFTNMKSLKHVGITAPSSSEVSQYLIDKFNELGIVFQFVKPRWCI